MRRIFASLLTIPKLLPMISSGTAFLFSKVGRSSSITIVTRLEPRTSSPGPTKGLKKCISRNKRNHLLGSFFYFQLDPTYVVSFFVFLLLGLASLSSSINLLVLRFMILSLEEDEEEFDLQDVTQNVITVDDEYLNGQSMMNARRLALRHQRQETVSVCSCTCYPGGKRSKKDPWYLQLWYKCQRIPKPEDDDHIFCAETMSISKSKKYAVKRNSM